MQIARNLMPAGKKTTRVLSALVAPSPSKAALFIPHSARIARIGELLVEIELLRNDILACKMCPDIGTDYLTQHRDVLKRVQIKSQEADSKFPGRLTFSTRRSGSSANSSYADNEIDTFIFVHTELRRFFIVPAVKISPQRHKITFGPNSHSQWEAAWWVLKKI